MPATTRSVHLRGRIVRAGFRLAACLALGLTTASATAQQRPAHAPLTKPATAQFDLRPAMDIERVTVPDLDIKAIEIEDAERHANGEPPRYAIPHPVHITPANAGVWEDVVDAGARQRRVWRLRVACDNAVSLNLGFTEFHLPPGASLFVSSTDLGFIVRGFSSQDNADHGQLWTPPVPGNDLLIELTVDQGREHEVLLTLGSINAGYRGFKQIANMALSGSCNVDVICDDGDGWEDEIASVAVISTGGSTFCTGFMVNNVRQDLTPYFMTARHCGVTSSNAASLVAFWNYENSWCRPPGSPASGGPGDGLLTQFNTGSAFRAAYQPSDVTLVQLSASPDPTWFVSFAGWDATNTNAEWSVAIHHPNTDEKRISFDFDPTTITSYLGTAVPGDGTHYRIGNWEIGTTEPGSSGSPLFNQDHRVIGQLHGGYASCTSITADWYGNFAVSWIGGQTPATQLKHWLDPDNTGTLTLDTLSTRGLSVSPGTPVEHIGVEGGPFTNDPYVYTLSNNTATAVSYEVSLTTFVGLEINGGQGTLFGNLAAGGGTAMVTVTAGPAIAGLGAGVYIEDIVFTDLGSGISRTIRHTIEVGQTGITVSPAFGLETGGPLGGPFTGTQVYTVTSTRPTPVTVSVTGGAPWVSINGSAAPIAFTLTGTGSQQSVTIGIDASASSLSAGIYSADAVFTNTDGGTGSTSRTIDLDVGRIVYAATDLPLPILDHTTIYSYIEVTDAFCIGDLNVDIDITHTFIGDLIVELRSPDGTEVRLHNRTGGSADDIVVMFDDDGAGRVPDGPGLLADFDYGNAQGTWRLRVSDLAGGDIGTLNAWALRAAPIPGTCPAPSVVYFEPFDTNPGWTTEGLWAFGQPTGGGGQYGNPDPTSGYTGPYVYGYNLNGDYENNLPERHLTSTPFDFTGLSGSRVSFWRWLNVESPTYDKATFRISTDGINWTTIWQNPSTIQDNAWTNVTYNISAIADNQPTVYFRWTMGPTDSSWQFSGWNIDDLSILAIAPEPACPEDLDGDGLINSSDLLIVLGSWGPCAGCPADLNGDNQVDSSDLLQLLNLWGPCP